MKSFNVPLHYRSTFISDIKQKRKEDDKKKRNFSPTVLEFGSLTILVARHFGFCYGVENAIEIAFKAITENPGKRIFLLSEMIHNPSVNADLIQLGVRFIMDTKGNLLIDWDELNSFDIVIIPAFGTTIEIENKLKALGINPKHYETTCPFVEKVWTRAGKIGVDGYTIIIHGKPGHEETRATFSHSKVNSPTVIVKDMAQTKLLGLYITETLPAEQFYIDFKGQYSDGFDVKNDLKKIGVVNQTTMLASETQAIAEYLKNIVNSKYNYNETLKSFADTSDTLCYATNDNQNAVLGMLEEKANFCIVIGGYNSSNTSHLVELCEQKLPTYFIKDEYCIENNNVIRHFNIHYQKEKITENFIPNSLSVKVMISSGASCPDALVERVIKRLIEITGNQSYFIEM